MLSDGDGPWQRQPPTAVRLPAAAVVALLKLKKKIKGKVAYFTEAKRSPANTTTISSSSSSPARRPRLTSAAGPAVSGSLCRGRTFRSVARIAAVPVRVSVSASAALGGGQPPAAGCPAAQTGAAPAVGATVKQPLGLPGAAPASTWLWGRGEVPGKARGLRGSPSEGAAASGLSAGERGAGPGAAGEEESRRRFPKGYGGERGRTPRSGPGGGSSVPGRAGEGGRGTA